MAANPEMMTSGSILLLLQSVAENGKCPADQKEYGYQQ
jgi:hypothetical protein